MKIESKIKRLGGSHIDMGTKKYHFAPLEDGAHVAEVLDEAHQDRFLSITEGYRLYRPGQATSAPEAAVVQVIALGASGFDAEYIIGDKTYTFDEIVALAHKESGLEANEWNGMEEESRAGLIEEQLDNLAEAAGEGAEEGAEEGEQSDAAPEAPAAPKNKRSSKK